MFNRDGTSKQWCMLICSSCQRWGKGHGWESIAQWLGGDRSLDMKAAIRTLHTQKCFRHFAGQEHFTQLVPYAIRNFPCLWKNTSYCNEWLCTVSNQHVFLQRYPVCQAWLCFCAFVLFFFFFPAGESGSVELEIIYHGSWRNRQPCFQPHWNGCCKQWQQSQWPSYMTWGRVSPRGQFCLCEVLLTFLCWVSYQPCWGHGQAPGELHGTVTLAWPWH